METEKQYNYFQRIIASPYYKKTMKWFKISGIVLVILFLLVWGGATWYINNNKTKLLEFIQTTATDNINGNVSIGDLSLELWYNMPNVTIKLTDISISDSLITSHHRDLLAAKNIFVNFSPLSLILGKPKIKKVIVSDAAVNIFTDSTGYSNSYIFHSKKKNKNKVSNRLNINKFGLKNVQFVFDYYERKKEFKIDIKSLDGRTKTDGNTTHIAANISAYIHQLGFNIERGGFLKERNIYGKLKMLWNGKDKFLKVDKNKIVIDKDVEVYFAALFNLSPDNKQYAISIDAPKINYSNGRSMLSQHIASKLDSINIANPVNVHTDIKGIMHYPDTPHVVVTFSSKKNKVITPLGELNNATFAGRFDNEYIKGMGRGDDNATIYIDNLQADLWQMPIKVDSSRIIGLKQPILDCKVSAQFPVEKLNDLVGNSFHLEQGDAAFLINYTGPLSQHDTSDHSMIGYIKINNAKLNYLPRSLVFDQCNAEIKFTGSDIEIENVSLNSKLSNLQMNGVAHKFLNAYFNNQGKAVFNWAIKSTMVDLSDFRAFVAQRKSASNESSATKIRKMNSRVDKILQESDMHLNVVVDNVTYKRFTAQNINANIDLLESGIEIKHLKVNHADGQLTLSGILNQSSNGNPFNVQANINKVNVSKLFYAFDNFGFQNLTHNNIKGIFTADLNLSGGITESGAVLHDKFNGKINFVLDKGALIDYKPLLQVQKFAFKKRNLNHIKIENLSSTLDINNGKLHIPPTEIISSAIYLKIQGVYGFQKGTDISIEAPLRNPEKDKGKRNLKRRKGLVLYLRAKDNNDGNVKVNWDPLKKGLKENEAIDDDD